MFYYSVKFYCFISSKFPIFSFLIYDNLFVSHMKTYHPIELKHKYNNTQICHQFIKPVAVRK